MRAASILLCFGLCSMGIGRSKAQAEPTAPTATTVPADFWRVFVGPHEWTLHGAEGDRVIVSTYDIRKVGAADVARLRWKFVPKKPKKDGMSITDREFQFGGGALLWTQVAVTDAGLYILEAKDDDAAVQKALLKKPARSSPPRPYKATKANTGRYLEIEGDEVCWGWRDMSGQECNDICEERVCASSAGITFLSQKADPNDVFRAKPAHP